MANYVYGAGDVFLTSSAATPTSYRIGTLQETNLDIKGGALKKLYGAKRFPVAVARGEASITGKSKAGELQPEIIQAAVGGTSSTGSVELVAAEAATIPGSVAYTVTVSGSATYKDDRGVIDITSGLAMLRVASNPATGQYAVDVATGIYTFAAADASHTIRISYRKTVTTGSTLKITNTNMGIAPTYVVDLYNVTGNGQKYGVLLHAATLEGFSFGYKNTEFATPEINIEAISDSSDAVADFYFPV